MNIYTSCLDDHLPTGSVVTLGNYDGLHRGHRRIMSRLLDRAKKDDSSTLVITFSPHPLKILCPSNAPLLLCTRRQKLEMLERQGVDGVLEISFTREFSTLPAETFIDRVLLQRLAVQGIVVGENVRFGYGKKGDLSMLEDHGRNRGFFVYSVPPVRQGGIIISSSAIRDAVTRGEVQLAQKMLGYPYTVRGSVVRGVRRGRSMGVPTVNLLPLNELCPENGVYITAIRIIGEDRFLPAVTNIGIRPTFRGKRKTIETHILDFEGNLYGEIMELRFYQFLRREQQFPNHKALRSQLVKDIKRARGFFEQWV